MWEVSWEDGSSEPTEGGGLLERVMGCKGGWWATRKGGGL